MNWNQGFSQKILVGAFAFLLIGFYQNCSQNPLSGQEQQKLDSSSSSLTPEQSAQCLDPWIATYQGLYYKPVIQTTCQQCHGSTGVVPRSFASSIVSESILAFKKIDVQGFLTKFSGSHGGGSQTGPAAILASGKSQWDQAYSDYQACLASKSNPGAGTTPVPGVDQEAGLALIGKVTGLALDPTKDSSTGDYNAPVTKKTISWDVYLEAQKTVLNPAPRLIIKADVDQVIQKIGDTPYIAGYVVYNFRYTLAAGNPGFQFTGLHVVLNNTIVNTTFDRASATLKTVGTDLPFLSTTTKAFVALEAAANPSDTIALQFFNATP